MNYTTLAEKMTGSELALVYSEFAETPVKKFSKKDVAVRRTSELLKQKRINTAQFKHLLTRERQAEIGLERKSSFPGPKGKLSGKKLYKVAKENPRRDDSCGWHSFNLIRNGMTFEEYRAAGGRTIDLKWDIAHGNVEAKK